MKKLLHILFIFGISLNGYSQSNIYHPLPKSNAIWKESRGDFCDECSKYKLYIIGDTVVNDKLYHMIQKEGTYYAWVQPSYCDWGIIAEYCYYYRGAYRNDSINRKVFYLAPNSQIETLLYDFDLQVNDTLSPTEIFHPSWHGGNSFVSEIDSIMIKNSYHKRFWLSFHNTYNNWPKYGCLIEGIGSSQGLLNEIEPNVICSDLICFKQDGKTVFPDSTSDCILSSVSDKTNKEPVFTISPNPFYSTCQVTCKNFNQTFDLVIFDLMGTIKKRISNLKSEDKMDMSEFNQGIYLYNIIRGKNIISFGKLIKI